MSEEIHAIYRRTIARYKSGKTIFKAEPDETGAQDKARDGQIICTGMVEAVAPGIPVILTGEWQSLDIGYLFAISSLKTDAGSAWDMARIIKGIFPSLPLDGAEGLIEQASGDPWEAVRKDGLEGLCRLWTRVDDKGTAGKGDKGSGTATKKKIKELKELTSVIEDNLPVWDLYKELSPYGLSFEAIKTIYEKTGNCQKEACLQRPYSLMISAGIDFEICDHIADKTKKKVYDKERCRALTYEALRISEDRGSTSMGFQPFYKSAKNIMERSAFTESIDPALFIPWIATSPGVEVTEDGKLHLKRLLREEREICKGLERITSSAGPIPLIDGIDRQFEEQTGVTLYDAQRGCFDILRSGGVKIITGAPGTGKTTVINALIYAYERSNPGKAAALCAPTGRAAQRLAEATGRKAQTIHKLLGYQPYGDGDQKCSEIEADAVIVDEMSMVDTELFALLVNSVRNHALLILCGDPGQLPSVGAGSVFRDLIKNGKWPVHILDEIMRQGEGSSIVKNAGRISKGYPHLDEDRATRIIRAKDAGETGRSALSLAKELYDKEGLSSFQILSPAKRGEAGVLELNQMIQEAVNPAGTEIPFGKHGLRIGDKVLLTRNDYESDYFNGDLGTITSYTTNAVEISLADGREVRVARTKTDDISLAYAMTVHKSQGSEFPIVCVVLQKHPSNMLQRKLLFTAATRAKEKLIIISEGDALETAIGQDTITERETYLPVLLADDKGGK